MKIPTNRVDLLFSMHGEEYEKKALEILRSGEYILSGEVSAFEDEFAAYNGAGHCVGVACGLDALYIALRALDISEGDEVIVQGNTFIATFVAVSMTGATPVVADAREDFMIDVEDIRRKITSRTKAVIVTQLFGFVADMDRIARLCDEFGLKLIEDAAQAHGAEYRGKKAGTFGNAGCFSFYPTKNLGGFGDGGAVITDSGVLDGKMRVIRSYGNIRRNEPVLIGKNSRLDAIQAGLLRVRLKHLDEINAEKRKIAAAYSSAITNPFVRLPVAAIDTVPVWHQYVVRSERRDELKAFLADQGVETDIHYPTPPHLTKAYEHLGMKAGSLPVTEQLSKEMLSLPIWLGMSGEEISFVANAINSFS